VAATYLAAGVLSLELYPVGDGLAGIWPPAGIAVAAALIVGPFATASILVGDFLFSLYAGWPPIPALTLALGSLAEVLVAWLLLVRWMPIDLRLQRTRDVAAFIVMGALPGALLCVALRVGLLALLGRGNELTAEHVSGLVIGFVAHSLGILVVAPVVLTWTAEPGLPRQRIEFYLLLLAAINAQRDRLLGDCRSAGLGNSLHHICRRIVGSLALRPARNRPGHRHDRGSSPPGLQAVAVAHSCSRISAKR
jgi:integral membrane sensor domain MASE1